MKKNCWEIKKCGREAGGSNIKKLGVCPASLEKKLDGIHAGKNAGRACWVIAGTLCKGEVQGSFAKKFNDCQICNFYLLVKEEDNSRFKLSATLMSILNK